MKQVYFFLFICLLHGSIPAYAQSDLALQVQALQQTVLELQRTVETQQKEIEVLKGGSRHGHTVSSAPVLPGSVSQGKWNPDIGVIADTVLKLDSPKEDAEGADRISVRELELILGSYVDPYSRLDVNIAFSDFEDVHLQEAYLTRFGLPWEITARIGRFKPKVGKALLFHRDILDTTDYPLVIRRYFGTDGLNKTGIDLTKPLDLPFESAHEVVFGIIEGGAGEGGLAFGDTRRRPTIYSHLKNFWDVSDVTSFELGASHMAGSADADASFETNVLALDGTLIHLYGPDQRIKLQSELFYLNRNESIDDSLFGAYGLFDVRFHKQWSSGFRMDYVEPVNNKITNPDDEEFGYTGYITFHQTEFARWRIQASHFDLPTGEDENQVFIQGIFAIGEHKHKLE
jgi:hypothetical protein